MKKLFSLLLALVMLFSVAGMAEEEQNIGVIGGADGPTSIWTADSFSTFQQMVQDAIAAGRKVTVAFSIPEVEGINTGNPTVDGALTDLVKALGAYVSMQGDEYNMGLSLSDQDVLTLGVAVNGEDVYVKSNLIGGTVVIGASEVEAIINRLLDMLVMMEAMMEEEAAYYKEQIAMLGEEFKIAFAQSMEQAITEQDMLNLDYSSLSNVFEALVADVEELDAVVVPRMCDPAVKGAQLSLDNGEFVGMIRSFIRFIKDNPALMNYMGGAYFTEEDQNADWEANGEFYQENGYYSSKEEYIADNPTFAQMLDQLMAELDTAKLLDGEFVTAVYTNDADEIVYLTSTLPMFSEELSVYETDASAEVKGTTEVLSLVYTRQTVAQGVSHVCTIDVDGEGAVIDVLVQENGVQFRLSDMASQALLLTINATNEDGVIKGTYVTNEEEENVCSGSFSFSHEADEASVKTAASFDMTIAYTPAAGSAETPSLNGMTLPGYQAAQPKAKTDTFAFSYLSDCTRNGVDVNGKETFTVQFNDVRVVAECVLTTSEPEDSIMSGEVVRPAELDEAAFMNWFVGAANSVSSWLGTLMMALPESVLTLLLSMSMM